MILAYNFIYQFILVGILNLSIALFCHLIRFFKINTPFKEQFQLYTHWITSCFHNNEVEDNESENNTSSGQNHVKVEKPTENTAEENIPDSTQESKEQEKVSNIKIEPPSRKEGEQDR